jgi:F-type H+-transporting ATPase subunit b
VSITLTLFGQILTFSVLVAFVWKVLWDPITQMMEKRRAQIVDGLAAADRGKHELELAERRATERLREAKQDAAEIIVTANKRSDEIVEEAKEQAKIEGQRQLKVALAEIEQEINRAKGDMRRQMVNLALATAEKVLEREIDAAVHAQFLDEMIKKL